MLADSLSDLNPNYPKAWQLVLGGVEAHAATAAAVAVWRAGRVALDIQACVRAPQPMEDCTGFGLITRAQRLDCVFLGDDVSDKMVVRLLALCPAARCFLRNLVRVDGPCVEVAGVAFDFTTREETEDGDLILKHSFLDLVLGHLLDVDRDIRMLTHKLLDQTCCEVVSDGCHSKGHVTSRKVAQIIQCG